MNKTEEITTNLKICRDNYMAEKIVIVNGHPGCGKTMLSPIIAALDRVELLTYAYELEHTCAFYHLKKIDFDAAVSMVGLIIDKIIYHTMMSREVNFRPSDISSVFRHPHPVRYIHRLFRKGDEAIPERIKKEKPILHLTTHNLLAFSEPLFAALKERLIFIEVVRHPLYMLKQQALNMDNLFTGNARDLTVYFADGKYKFPYFVYGCEELLSRSNSIEKTIFLMERLTKIAQEKYKYLKEHYNANILIIPFEEFVVNPWPYMKQIEEKIETKITAATRSMMKKQNVPRKMYAQGLKLKIYKLRGWQPPKAGSDEKEEFRIRREFAKKAASVEAVNVLDKMCREYEEKYMGGKKGKESKDGYIY